MGVLPQNQYGHVLSSARHPIRGKCLEMAHNPSVPFAQRTTAKFAFHRTEANLAYYWGEAGADLDLFNFDRCTGMFSDPLYIPIDDYDGGGGVAFSSTGRYVYTSSVFDVYQFDTQVADTLDPWCRSRIGTVPTRLLLHSQHCSTLFNSLRMERSTSARAIAPNILHVINDPDEPGR